MDENLARESAPSESAAGSRDNAASPSTNPAGSSSCDASEAVSACQCAIHASNIATSTSPLINVGIYPTTGGHFDLQVRGMDTIEHLKKMISKKLKVAKERICLLYKEKDLREGSLRANNVQEGSRIILLPMVETGLLTQRPEQSVLQALESLSDAQVNDFLSGKAPLNLTMRLGDHMMFIQLQLSTVGTALARSKGLPVHHHGAASGSSAAPKTAVPTTSRSVRSVPTSMARSPVQQASPSTSAGAPPNSTCGRLPGPGPAVGPSSQAATTRGHRQRCLTDVTHLLDTRTLAEASRNLSQTLRHLSSQALNNRTDHEECPQHGSSRRQGAIIESMHHHGRGVYSGTFSGTLNPALQDRHGHPKRDISTIVHILNDLLGATPQYRRHNARSIEPPAVVQLHKPSVTSIGNASGHTPETTTKEYSRLSLENQATRGKMEQLQLMLEERRARRRARRETHAPYPLTWSTSSGGLMAPLADPCEDVAVLPAAMAEDSALSNEDNEQDIKSQVTATGSDKSGDEGSVVSSAGGTDAETPMDCDAPAAANEYLKLNPETVVV